MLKTNNTYPVNFSRHELFFLGLLIILTLVQWPFIIDYHHHGLMYSNAMDLNNGKIPYKEIYIQYGFLTTYVHSIALKVYSSYLSLAITTVSAYIIGIYFITRIYCLYCVNRSWFFIPTIVMFQPAIYLPWSNYICFPFFLAGIFFGCRFLKDLCDLRLTAYSGALLGLAVLARESISIIVLATLVAILFCVYLRGVAFIEYLKIAGSFLLSFLLPLIVFLVYLDFKQIIGYWVLHSYQIPQIYIEEIFPWMNSLYFPFQFLKALAKGLIDLNIRWWFLSLIILTGIWVLVNPKFLTGTDKSIRIIGVVTVLSTTAMFHIPEVWRFATLGLVGIVIPFLYFKSARAFWSGLVMSLVFSIYSESSGFKLKYSELVKKRDYSLSTIPTLHGVAMDAESHASYLELASIFQSLHKNYCPVEYIYNNTDNNFFYTISGLKKAQIAPYEIGNHMINGQSFDALRPDLGFNFRLQNAETLILFSYDVSVASMLSDYKDHSVVWSGKVHGQTALLYLPTKCRHQSGLKLL